MEMFLLLQENISTSENLTHEIHLNKLFEFFSKEEGADFNIVDSCGGWCPMSRAIEIGNVELMKLIIDKSNGADLNLSSCNQNTPLIASIYRQKLEIAAELLKSGADVNKEDILGWTPLTMAIKTGNIEMVTFLSSNGADLNFMNQDNCIPITIAIKEGKG